MEQTNSNLTEYKRKSKRVFTLVIILTVIISFACGFFVNALVQGRTRRNLNSVISLIEEHGIFVTKNIRDEDLTDDEMLDLIVKTLLSSDKYARYYGKQEYQALKSQNNGNYSNFGFSVSQSLKVYSVVGNSPAEKSGLRVGDKIVSISKDGEQATVIDEYGTLTSVLEESQNASVFTITAERGEEQKTFTVKKAEYVASYVKYFDDEKSVNLLTDGKSAKVLDYDNTENFNLPSDTAMIVLQEFMGDADIQFGGAIEYMKSRGKTKLILDLRGNGGGRLDVLCDIAGYLVKNCGTKNSPIVYSQAKNSQETYYTSFNKYYDGLQKTVVLCDGNTASASECLIGAMLYYGKEELDGNFSIDDVVASKDASGHAGTYGKGIMQTTYELASGDAVKFTTAKIFQPDKTTCIQDVGIVPENPLNAVDDADAVKRAIEIVSRK